MASPDISVTRAEIVDEGPDATQVGVRLALENRSDVPVKLDIWDYVFTTGGARYAGRWSAGLTVPPQERVETTIPAVVPKSALAGIDSPWNVSGQVTYLAPSRIAEALFEVGLNRPTASFHGSGTAIEQRGETKPVKTASAPPP